MKCKCKYYLRDKDGTLVCSVCGKPAHSNEIEDKVEERHEDKQIWPPESKRIARPKPTTTTPAPLNIIKRKTKKRR